MRSLINELQKRIFVDATKTYKMNRIAMNLENEIKLKFQEIITKLQNKQNDLLLDLQKWKTLTMQQITNTSNDQLLVIQPRLEFASFLDLNDVTSCINLNIMEFDGDTKKDENRENIKTNKLNPFSDEYVEQQISDVDHRAHFIHDDGDKYHPKQLLDSYNNEKYYSDKICNFEIN